LRSWRGVLPLEGRAPEKTSFIAVVVVVVVGGTYYIVVVMGMMIRILMILDPG